MKILFVMVKEDYIDPLNIELLSALAKRDGHETFLNVLEHNNLKEEMRSIRPDLVAYSAKTGESNVMLRANRWIKSELGDKVTSVMGGPHPTFNHARMRLYQEELCPEEISGALAPRLPVENTMLDVLVVGEADESWPFFLRPLRSGNQSTGFQIL